MKRRKPRKPAMLWPEAWLRFEVSDAGHIAVYGGDANDGVWLREAKQLNRWLTRAISYLESRKK